MKNSILYLWVMENPNLKSDFDYLYSSGQEKFPKFQFLKILFFEAIEFQIRNVRKILHLFIFSRFFVVIPPKVTNVCCFSAVSGLRATGTGETGTGTSGLHFRKIQHFFYLG